MKYSDKVHNSIFDPSITIDTPNMLTELLMSNYFKLIRKPIPKFPFWRGVYSEGDNHYIKFLSKKYMLEVVTIKRLLKKYKPKVIAILIKDLNLGTLALLKKDDRKRIYSIFDGYQIKFDQQSTEPVNLREVVKECIPNEYSLFKQKLI